MITTRDSNTDFRWSTDSYNVDYDYYDKGEGYKTIIMKTKTITATTTTITTIVTTITITALVTTQIQQLRTE